MSESCTTVGESTSVLEGCNAIVEASPTPLRVTLTPLFSTCNAPLPVNGSTHAAADLCSYLWTQGAACGPGAVSKGASVLLFIGRKCRRMQTSGRFGKSHGKTWASYYLRVQASMDLKQVRKEP